MSYLDYLKSTENLLLILPILVILVAIIIIFLPYITNTIKKRIQAAKAAKEEVKVEDKVDFRAEYKKIEGIKDPNKAIKNLSILINRFLSQLFNIKRAFTYEEIKKESEKQKYREIVELCKLLSELNFKKDNHTTQDFEKLSIAFKNILYIHERKIAPTTRSIEPAKEFATIFTWVRVKLKIMWYKIRDYFKKSEEKRLKKRLHMRYPHLFKAKVEENKGDISKLITKSESEKQKTKSAHSLYNYIPTIYENLPEEKKKLLRQEVEELYTKMLNLIALKASCEMVDGMLKAINHKRFDKTKELMAHLRYTHKRLGLKASYELVQYADDSLSTKDYKNAKEILEQLRYVYKRLVRDMNKEVSQKWNEFIHKIR